MFAWIDLLYLAAGGALVWFEKDRFLTWYHGAEAFATKLEADAAALKAKVATVKAAVKS